MCNPGALPGLPDLLELVNVTSLFLSLISHSRNPFAKWVKIFVSFFLFYYKTSLLQSTILYVQPANSFYLTFTHFHSYEFLRLLLSSVYCTLISRAIERSGRHRICVCISQVSGSYCCFL